jgi:voltage-gated potassium channel
VPVVAVDRRDAPLVRARDAGAHALVGDASQDETLRCAGIGRARALVAAAGHDPDNLVITMTARMLQPALPIVACTEFAASIPKLLRAGATRTASPHTIAGERIADVVLRPSAGDADLRLREELVQPGSPLDGTTVAASGLRATGGPVLVAIRRRDGQMAFNPGGEVRVDAGDVVITMDNHGPGQDGQACVGPAT